MRDIDHIILRIRQRYPDVVVTQYRPRHPADDDGIWWFNHSNANQDIQIESTTGMCPFIIETDEHSSFNALTGYTIDENVARIVTFLDADRASSH
jgi:hypothetical protein